MIDDSKLKTFLDLIKGSSREELIWMNGYLNGLNSEIKSPSSDPNKKLKKVTIAYGTETGNSKRIATEFAAKAKTFGINAKIQSLDQYKLTDLSKEEYFFTVISTHGDGEPPAAAKKFYDHVLKSAERLEHLKYGVLALGDTSYPLFCKAGEDVDVHLSKLGAERIVPLQKCDIDYDPEAKKWVDDILGNLKSATTNPSIETAAPIKKKTGRSYYQGQILSHVNLNDIGSNKETYHIEIEAANIEYEPGDSLGIVPSNDEGVVNKIIGITGIDPLTTLQYKNELQSIKVLLTNNLNIIFLPERVVKKYASIVDQDIPETKMDLLDILKIYPVKDADQFIEVVKILEPITPRLYSIASSPNAHEGEVHITVARNIYSVDNQTKYGLGSNFLAGLKNGSINFYIHPNNNFRLPEPESNIIMIGPGTGIAPFRSFLSERDVTGATGKNWLFFGEQHFVSDFLYQTEIQNWVETGVLTKISTAFSRDQESKIYVQNRMLEHQKELFTWIDSGSYLYICGAKEPMSIDVEKTLITIIMEEGQRSFSDATLYLDGMKEDGRYILDVY